MQIALGLARSAGQAGEVPVGAVVTHQGEVIGMGANARVLPRPTRRPTPSCWPFGRRPNGWNLAVNRGHHYT